MAPDVFGGAKSGVDPLPRSASINAGIPSTACASTPRACSAANTLAQEFSETACGTPFDFQVPDGTGTIDVVANATAPTDDILLKLVYNGTTLASSDEATSPEAVHYSNGGVIPSGTYSAIVCPSPNPAGPFTLMTYSGTVTLTDAAVPNPNPKGVATRAGRRHLRR